MRKPFIYIHSLMSLDGKLVGNFTKLPQESAAAPFFKKVGFGGPDSPYEMDAWLNGTKTAETDYTYGAAPELDENAAPVPDGDFIADVPASRWLVVLDRRGKLGWQSNRVPYTEPNPYVISVLTEQVSNAYRDFLRRKNISYIICGEKEIDFELMFIKLMDLFGIKNLKVGGGGTINWTFLRRGYVDEVSVIVVPAADGSADTPSFFQAREGMSDDTPVGFRLIHSEVDPASGAVWLRYKVEKVWSRSEFAGTYGLGQKDFVGEAE